MSDHDPLNIVVGLDIGSSKICVAVCDINRGELHLQGISTSLTAGVEKGRITDQEAFKKSIERCIKRAESDTGHVISQVVVNVVPAGLESITNVGLVVNKNVDGYFIEDDRIEAIGRSKNVVKSSNQRILHAIPLSYRIDGRHHEIPVGQIGQNLEVDTHLIFCQKETLSEISHALRSLDLIVKGITYDVFGSSQIFLTEDERHEGVYFIDFGAQYTKMAYFENNVMQKTWVVPYGGATVTSDIAQCLNVSIPEAERIKILYGHVLPSEISPDELISITTVDGDRKPINRLVLCEIMAARVQEILELISTHINSHNHMPIVISGGASQQVGLDELLNQYTHGPLRVGLIDAVHDIIADPATATAVGLVIYGLRTGALQEHKATQSVFSNWWRSFF